MMNELLRDLINIGKVVVFIDNVIVRMEDKKGHNKLVVEIVKRLEENDLYIKPEKYKQKVREVDFLGVVLGPERIKMKEAKVKAVLDWPVPKSVKDIQKFLELANYYRRFIEGFAKVARPLHELMRKDQKQDWGFRQEKLFKALKKQFTTGPILVALDLNKKMRIEVDVSDYAIGRVLSMECKDGRQRPIAFLSKSLNETEINYEIYNKEMLVVIRGLENWQHLLESTKFKFEIQMDHKNLKYFMKVQKLNQKQARWVLYLSRFDFTLKYVSGTKMGKADVLSRRPDWKVGIEKNNKDQVFIKEDWLHNM